mgnify:CR=1 FL=1
MPIYGYKGTMKIVENLKITVATLVVLAIILMVWMPPLGSLRLVFGGFYVIIVPGLLMTYAFFKNEELNFVERLHFALALSIVKVSLLIFNLGRIGMWINAINILGVVTLVNGAALLIILWRNRLMIKRQRT